MDLSEAEALGELTALSRDKDARQYNAPQPFENDAPLFAALLDDGNDRVRIVMSTVKAAFPKSHSSRLVENSDWTNTKNAAR